MIFSRKRGKDAHVKETKLLNENLQHLVRSIEEASDDQREIVKQFKIEMENFVTERTLESCIKTLNLSMQLANVREQLLGIYKQYISILENELRIALDENEKKNSQTSRMWNIILFGYLSKFVRTGLMGWNVKREITKSVE